MTPRLVSLAALLLAAPAAAECTLADFRWASDVLDGVVIDYAPAGGEGGLLTFRVLDVLTGEAEGDTLIYVEDAGALDPARLTGEGGGAHLVLGTFAVNEQTWPGTLPGNAEPTLRLATLNCGAILAEATPETLDSLRAAFAPGDSAGNLGPCYVTIRRPGADAVQKEVPCP